MRESFSLTKFDIISKDDFDGEYSEMWVCSHVLLLLSFILLLKTGVFGLIEKFRPLRGRFGTARYSSP